ncbi:MAG: PKD domain-containing protein [Pseudomonadales bacterium]|nr:PKD domain-containing protein [Pseudomonadales bacterium]
MGSIRRVHQLALIAAATTLITGCPLINKSKSEPDTEDETSSLRMLFSADCSISTCYVDTSATFDNNDDVSEVICDMGDGNIVNVANLEMNFDYTYSLPGDYEITCSVTDSSGDSDSDSEDILVSGLFAHAGPDQTVPEGQSITLDGSLSEDSSGNGLTYRWAKISGPTGFFLNDPTVESPTFAAPSVEGNTIFIYRLEVDNGIDDPQFDTVSITVLEVDGTDLPR